MTIRFIGDILYCLVALCRTHTARTALVFSRSHFVGFGRFRGSTLRIPVSCELLPAHLNLSVVTYPDRYVAEGRWSPGIGSGYHVLEATALCRLCFTQSPNGCQARRKPGSRARRFCVGGGPRSGSSTALCSSP